MKVSDLTNRELDLLVAKLENVQITEDEQHRLMLGTSDGMEVEWAPSRNWTQGGPILERKRIIVGPWKGSRWAASAEAFPESANEVDAFGDSYLDAGMRCYLVSALGEELPDRYI